MADYQWTGGAGTGDFGTPVNWQNTTTAQNPATSPPGPSDSATINAAGLTITGAGDVGTLELQGTATIAGELVLGGMAGVGTKIDGQMKLRHGTVLTTLLLDVGTAANGTGTLDVGEHSSVVIAGVHPANNYAVAVAAGTGSTGILRVRGPGAVVSSGIEPLSIGQNGNGVLQIEDGGVVTAGNQDPSINFAVVIGNHTGSKGKVVVKDAALLTDGAILVGRSAPGALEIHAAGVVGAGNLLLGVNASGVGSAVVRGEAARLVLSGNLQIGAPGSGSLAVGEHGLVSAGGIMTVNGPVALDAGSIVAGSVVVGATGTVSGEGTVTAAGGLTNLGALEAHRRLTVIGPLINSGALGTGAEGHLLVAGPLSGTGGTVALAKHGSVSLDAAAAGQTIVFSGTGATLVLRNPAAFNAAIQGFGKDDKIEIDAVATGVAISGGIMTLTGPGGPVAQVTLVGAYTVANLHLAAVAGGRSVVRFHP